MQYEKIYSLASVMEEITPFLNKYKDKVIVIKYGGNAMINGLLKKAVMKDLLLLNQLGVKTVLVHGGGIDIDNNLKAIGKKSQFIDGLRVTDKETMAIVQQVLAGKVNKDLVALLGDKGIGLCGVDGQMLLAEKSQRAKDLGYVGEIKEVNCNLIQLGMNAGLIPVIATIASDAQGIIYNINADIAASKIAIALDAAKLIIMTDISGLLRDYNNPDTLISHLDIAEIPELINDGAISGGMIPKVNSCVDCVKQGVPEVAITDGRVEHSILLEMFSPKGCGTLFYNKGSGNEK
ncbi:MAG: acetylglutamate kinase [Cardiobacteriaceae bacterium]|nr:acetylglutamate kinase [Cardiobacteriaceae bacterium]